MQVQSSKGKAERPAIVAMIIFVAALVVRLAYLHQFAASPFFDPELTTLAMLAYDKMAVAIASGDWLGRGVFEILPGYGYALGAIYTVFGRNLAIAYFFQALLGAAIVVFAYLLALRVADKRVALITAIAGVLSQTLVFHTGMLTGDTLAAFLVMLMLLVVHYAIDRGNILYFLAAGILAGFGTITRGTPALFVLLFIPWYAIAGRRNLLRKVLPNLAALVFGAILIVAPITVRNYVVGDDFVLVTAHDGMNVYLGYNPKARGWYQALPELRGSTEMMSADARAIAEKSAGKKLRPSEVSAYWKGKAADFIISNPSRALYLAGEKVAVFFNHFDLADLISLESMKKLSWILDRGLIPIGLVLPFAMVGMAVAVRRRRFGPLYIFVAANLMAVIITVANARYRLTSVPVFLIFGGTSIVWVKDNIKSKKRVAIWVLGLILCFVAVYRPIIVRERPSLNAYNLGSLYIRQGKMDLAVKELRKAVQLDPANIDARFRLGFAIFRLNRIDEAERELDALLRANPDYIDALNLMGDISLHRGNKEKALEYWQRSIEINPDQPRVKNIIRQNR